jgi:hypothetical protein
MINPIGRLAILLTRMDEGDRASARRIEDAADQAAMDDANRRVTQLLAKADADRDSAFAKGIGDIAGGACVAGAAFFPPATGPNQAPCCESSTAGRPIDWNAILNGGGKALPGIGEMVAGQYEGEAGRDNAEAAKLEAEAQADMRRYDRAQTDEKAANDAMQKVEQFLDQAQQTENATRLAAATFQA